MHEPPDPPVFEPSPPPIPTDPGYGSLPGATRPTRVPDAGSGGRASFIGLVALVLVIVVAVVQRMPETKPKAKAPDVQGAALLEGSDELGILGRLFVKFAHALPQTDRAAMNASMSQIDLAARTPTDRLRAAVVYGELVGAEEAIGRLKKLREGPEAATDTGPAEAGTGSDSPGTPTTPPTSPTPSIAPEVPAGAPSDSPVGAGAPVPDLTPDLDALELIYSNRASELTAEQRESLTTRHGWFGKLALTFGAPDTDPARAPLLSGGLMLIVVFMIFGVLLLGAAVAGMVLFIVAMVMFGSGTIRPGFKPPAPGGSVYLETFAVFLGSFLALAMVGALVGKLVGAGSVWLGVGLLAAHWLLLAVLFYPRARGVRWSELRTGLGWTAGRGVASEIWAGIVGYLAGLPVFFAGVVVALIAFLIQTKITGEKDPPKNPLFERLAEGGPLMLVVFFVMATVWAPLVEEGVFRGCLYRHLRGRLHPILAGMGSAAAFGIIHPVPLVLTVPLMALGFNFAMIREWRGSLIGPMTAHCLHNATVLTLLISVLSLVGD